MASEALFFFGALFVVKLAVHLAFKVHDRRQHRGETLDQIGPRDDADVQRFPARPRLGGSADTKYEGQ